MAYSETKVVLGGLAHIPIIIGFFYLIRRQYSFGAMLRTGKNAHPNVAGLPNGPAGPMAQKGKESKNYKAGQRS